ncbi:hypothetical protein ABVT39_004083 [Epinephelus coioides]
MDGPSAGLSRAQMASSHCCNFSLQRPETVSSCYESLVCSGRAECAGERQWQTQKPEGPCLEPVFNLSIPVETIWRTPWMRNRFICRYKQQVTKPLFFPANYYTIENIIKNIMFRICRYVLLNPTHWTFKI